MNRLQRSIAIVGLAAGLAAVPVPTHAAQFNDEYVFATTKAVNDMDANPALKVTLYPATVVLDTVFLPFAVVAGFVG